MTDRTRNPLECTLGDFFRQRLNDCVDVLDPRPQEDTLWYIGALLARLGDSRELFSLDEGRLDLRPLALLYKDAHEAATAYERYLILRQLGDQALFIGALFPESYARRGFRQDYFVGMGGGAYDSLAEMSPAHRHVFTELAERFVGFLELVERACMREVHNSVEDILALYQRWQVTGSQRLASQLQALGISLEGGTSLH